MICAHTDDAVVDSGCGVATGLLSRGWCGGGEAAAACAEPPFWMRAHTMLGVSRSGRDSACADAGEHLLQQEISQISWLADGHWHRGDCQAQQHQDCLSRMQHHQRRGPVFCDIVYN